MRKFTGLCLMTALFAVGLFIFTSPALAGTGGAGPVFDGYGYEVVSDDKEPSIELVGNRSSQKRGMNRGGPKRHFSGPRKRGGRGYSKDRFYGDRYYGKYRDHDREYRRRQRSRGRVTVWVPGYWTDYGYVDGYWIYRWPRFPRSPFFRSYDCGYNC